MDGLSRRRFLAATAAAAVAVRAPAVPAQKRRRTLRFVPPPHPKIPDPISSPPFIMPARLAATDPNEQVRETVGSGPYRFVRDEWEPGHQVVYARNADYVPRDEEPSGAAGGKRARVDRVEWRYIPDPATASAARSEERRVG